MAARKRAASAHTPLPALAESELDRAEEERAGEERIDQRHHPRRGDVLERQWIYPCVVRRTREPPGPPERSRPQPHAAGEYSESGGKQQEHQEIDDVTEVGHRPSVPADVNHWHKPNLTPPACRRCGTRTIC